MGEGVLRHSAEHSQRHLLRLPALAAWSRFVFLWTVDLALSPGSAVYVREHLGQQANVLHAPKMLRLLGWMWSFRGEMNRVSQQEFGRAGAG